GEGLRVLIGKLELTLGWRAADAASDSGPRVEAPALAGTRSPTSQSSRSTRWPTMPVPAVAERSDPTATGVDEDPRESRSQVAAARARQTPAQPSAEAAPAIPVVAPKPSEGRPSGAEAT